MEKSKLKVPVLEKIHETFSLFSLNVGYNNITADSFLVSLKRCVANSIKVKTLLY